MKHHNETDKGTLVWQLTLWKTWQPRVIRAKVEFRLEKVWKWQCFDCEFLDVRDLGMTKNSKGSIRSLSHWCFFVTLDFLCDIKCLSFQLPVLSNPSRLNSCKNLILRMIYIYIYIYIFYFFFQRDSIMQFTLFLT